MNSKDQVAKLFGLNTSEIEERAMLQRKAEGKGCFNCNYTGFLPDENNTHVMCSCTKEKFYKEIFIKADVPPKFIFKTIEDWETKTDSKGTDLGIQAVKSQYIKMLLKFYDKNFLKIVGGSPVKIKHDVNIVDNLHSLKFTGDNGSGKTFIASVMVQVAIRKGLSAKYYDWSELLETLIDFDRKDEATEIIEEFKTLDFIAVDGLQYFNINNNNLVIQLDRLGKARVNSGKPIFLMIYGDIDKIDGGAGFSSLIRSCLAIQLPHAVK